MAKNRVVIDPRLRPVVQIEKWVSLQSISLCLSMNTDTNETNDKNYIFHGHLIVMLYDVFSGRILLNWEGQLAITCL